MSFWAAAIPLLQTFAAGEQKRKQAEQLPTAKGTTFVAPPVAGSQRSDMARDIVLAGAKKRRSDEMKREQKEEAMEEQAKSVSKDVAEAAKR
tara:strand:+ start:13217 stop:13492 length:276 start_codon:yes stop_codon:yes gene_type:complete